MVAHGPRDRYTDVLGFFTSGWTTHLAFKASVSLYHTPGVKNIASLDHPVAPHGDAIFLTPGVYVHLYNHELTIALTQASVLEQRTPHRSAIKPSLKRLWTI